MDNTTYITLDDCLDHLKEIKYIINSINNLESTDGAKDIFKEDSSVPNNKIIYLSTSTQHEPIKSLSESTAKKISIPTPHKHTQPHMHTSPTKSVKYKLVKKND